MATRRLTDALVKALNPPSGRQQVIQYDDQVRGFGVRVTRKGARSFVLNYTSHDGRERRVTIGSSVHWGTSAAREEAKRLKRLVDAGQDPLADRKERREAITVDQLLDEYLASNRFASKASSTQASDRGRIKRHLRPLLGRRKADEVTSQDVERAFNAIVDGRTAVDVRTGKRGRARVTGGKGTARKAIKLLSAIYSWATATGRTDTNPCHHVDVGRDAKRDLVLDGEQYARLWHALATLEEAEVLRPAAADAIRLIALTGCRRGEAVGLRWRDVRLDQRVLVLTEHKTATSTGRPRVIGLSGPALRAVTRQPRGKPDEHVFASSAGPEKSISLAKPWATVRDAAKLPSEATLHTLRHSLATAYANAGAAAPQIAALLGHAEFATSQSYVHLAEEAHARIASEAARLILKNE